MSSHCSFLSNILRSQVKLMKRIVDKLKIQEKNTFADQNLMTLYQGEMRREHYARDGERATDAHFARGQSM